MNFNLFCRSAPASPSHIGISGTLTPDSLSRETSPIPEAMGGGGDDGHHAAAAALQPPHLPQQPISAPRLTQMTHEVRYSQSAPGSPSSSKYNKQIYMH